MWITGKNIFFKVIKDQLVLGTIWFFTHERYHMVLCIVKVPYGTFYRISTIWYLMNISILKVLICRSFLLHHLSSPPLTLPTLLLSSSLLQLCNSEHWLLVHYLYILIWLPLSCQRFELTNLVCESAALSTIPVRRSHKSTNYLFYLCYSPSIYY